MKNKPKKSAHIDVRVTPETKQKLLDDATNNGMNLSKYVSSILEKPVPLTHEEYIASFVNVNIVINLLRQNPKLSKQDIQEIEKAVESYAAIQ